MSNLQAHWRGHHGKSWKAKRPASWTNHKRVASSITRDVSSIPLWDDEIEERERLAKEKEQEKAESEDWDAPEAQTEQATGSHGTR